MPNDLTQYKTYDDAANAFKQSKQYRKLSDPAAQVDSLHTLRTKFYEAHGVHKDAGPTDITPPDPTKKEGTAPVAADAPRKVTPELAGKEGDQQPDVMGRLKAGAESLDASLHKAAGPIEGAMAPVDLLVKALPGDNIQAGIDAAMALSMLSGAGEVEGVGGLAYKALRELPAGVRGIGRWAMRTAIPAIGGAAGGATEGKTMEGAGQGALEQQVAEVGSTIFRGANKAIQKTDLKGLGNWLSEKLPDFPGLKSVSDFRKWFLRGELEDAASEKLGKIESSIGRQLSPKGATSISKATVFGPGQQDAAQDEALASLDTSGQKTAGALDRLHDAGTKSPQQAAAELDELHNSSSSNNKTTVFSKKPADPEKLYAKVKSLQEQLKAAKAGQKGSRVMDEIRTNLKQAQDDALAATKAAKQAKQPIDLKKAVADSNARVANGTAPPPRADTYVPPQKVVSPTLKVELPGPMADYLKVPRRSPLDFEWKDLVTHLNETENKGWALIGNPDPEKAELGKALRSSVFQAEHDAADALRVKVGDKVADEWLAQRQQYRAARVLTQLFRTPNLVDASGNIAWDEVQRLVGAAGKEGFYEDLKLAFGKDGADAFVDKLHRGESDVRDVPGRGVLTTHSRVYMHPGLGKLSPRIPLQVPVPTVRAGDVPFNLGRNRALSGLMVLGPERFVQMIDDMTKMGGQPGDAGAN